MRRAGPRKSPRSSRAPRVPSEYIAVSNASSRGAALTYPMLPPRKATKKGDEKANGEAVGEAGKGDGEAVGEAARVDGESTERRRPRAEPGVQGFSRRTPSDVSDEDRTVALEHRDEICRLYDSLTPPNRIAARLKLPVAAIELVLLLRTVEASRARDPAPSWSAPSPEPAGSIPSIYSALDESMRSLGIASGPRGYVLRRFQRHEPNDYEKLLDILASLQLPTGVARGVVDDYREAMEPSTRGDRPIAPRGDEGDELTKALRARRSGLARRLEVAEVEAEIGRLEREGRGLPPGAAAPVTPSVREQQLEERLKTLEASLAEFRVSDAVARATTPLLERIRSIESHQTHRTLEDIDVSSAAGKSQLQYQVATQGIAELSDRVKTAPHVLTKLDKVVDMALTSPGFQSRVRETFAAPGDLTGTIVEQSPEEMARAAAQLERVVERGRVMDAVGTTPPKRHAWVPGESRSVWDDVQPTVPNTEP